MATIAYSSQSSKAKPTKVAYCSIGGQAKRIKRVYGSVGGKAKIIYDTATVKYIKDNGYTNNTTVTYTEVIGKGCLIPQKDNLHWYKADGTEWNFSTDRIQADVTLYEAVYSSITAVTFDGSHYCPTDVKLARSEMDFRMYPCYASDITVQRRVLSIRGQPTVEMYINGAGYWNYGLSNTASNVRWSCRPNNVQAKKDERMWWRLNVSGSYHFSQVWTDSSGSGSWADVGAMTQDTTTATLSIGGCNAKTDLPFKGTLPNLDTTSHSFVCYQRKKGGSTVQGYVWNVTNKFYPLVSW